jgi:hypothetical protein
MKPIRPFTKDDIPQVADMFQRLILKENPSRRRLAPASLPEYFEQILFHNPWYDPETPSLVFEDPEGRIIGFLGVTPRPMLLRGQPIRVAISYHFMVEPDSRSSLAGVQLLKSFFSGPQDLSMTDGAGDVGRKVWEGVGGVTAFLPSLQWVRILRPSRVALSHVGKRFSFPSIARMLFPIADLSDAAAARLLPRFFPTALPDCSAEEPDAAILLRYLTQFSKTRAIQPVYDDQSLQWALNQAGKMSLLGSLEKVLVRDQQGEVLGWYLYYLVPGGTSTVLQLAAKRNRFGAILDHLFDHARRHGASVLVGRLEPQYMQELTDRNCYFNRLGSWALVHSTNSELLHAIQRGDAFLSKLEGEWCLLF